MPVSVFELADVAIRLGHIDLPTSMSETIARGRNYCVTNEGIYRFWDDTGTLFVRDGREIIVDPKPGVDANVLRAVLLGTGFAALCHQRGRLVLHASAVALEGNGVAFVGPPEYGKSTTAFALCVLGHQLIADDVTSISFENHEPVVFPAYPEIGVSLETLAAFSYDPMVFPKVEPPFEKRAIPTERPSIETIPLRRIYSLIRGETNVIEVMSQHEALAELVRQSYCARFLPPCGDSAHFIQCADLLKTVRILRLTVRDSLKGILDVARAIEKDVKAAVAQTPA